MEEMDFKPLPKRRHTRDEKELSNEIGKHYSDAKVARQNTCYHDAGVGSTVPSNAGATGGSWPERWDLQEKMSIMWFERPSRDQFESNVKSPMVTGRIESTIQKLRRINIQFAVRPEDTDDPADVRKAKIIEALANNLFLKKQFKQKLITWYRDILVHGTAFLQVYYAKKERTVRMPITDPKLMTPEEKKAYKDGGVAHREITQSDVDDITIEPVKIQEIYVDPSARYLHGDSYEAQWIIRRMLPSYDQFMAMYEGDEDAKNLSKVRPIGSYAGDEHEFFEPPKDISDMNVVEVLHYYNKRKDRYAVRANDVIIKDGPLPYIHKQLPFVAGSLFEVAHQFYHSGIPDRLLAIQSEEEILKNMTYDRLHITTDPMFKIRRNIYGETSKSMAEGTSGLLAPVNQPDDITVQDYPTTSFDVFRAVDNLSRDAAIATQIDPMQMGVMQKYVSATTAMMTKEQMDTFIYGLIDSTTAPLTTAGYQIISLMRQFYTVPRVIEKIGKTETEPRRVRIQGIEVNPKTFEIKKKKSHEYSFVKIKDDYFDIHGDWDVIITPESMETISKAVEMQKSQANIAQLAPFMVDPSDTAKVRQHPAGWVDGPGFLRHYFETNGLPDEYLVSAREDDDITMQRATDQGKRILAGEDVPGIAGESDAHKQVHVAQIKAQRKKVEEMEKTIGELGPLAQTYADLLPETRGIQEAKMIQQMLAMHLEVDDLPVTEGVQQEVQSAMPQQPQVPMPPGLTPAGSSQPPVPAGGNQQAGMMGEPRMGGPGGQTGRPALYEQ